MIALIPTLFITINSYAMNRNIDSLTGLPLSTPVSYVANHENISNKTVYTVLNGKVYRQTDDEVAPLEFNEGLYDSKTDLFYYTLKSNNSWGADKFIYVYSIPEKKIINKIEFDNSGYFKYPISISPDSKKLVLAERAQSAGDVNVQIIDLNTNKQISYIQGAYIPSTAWTDNSNIAYFKTGKKCKGDNCYEDSLNLEKLNIDNNTTESKLVSDRLSHGNLPHIANINVRNKTITLNLQNDPLIDNLQTIDINF